MKKFIITLIATIWLSCGLIQNSFAALNAATVWDVRTTGSANNGGGFKSGTGTDQSQSDAAADSGTDLACADGDAAAPVVTSATHDFVTADVGNIINITEVGDGFTLGRYQIASVNANAATLDRACGANGALTGGDWYLGGAVNHPDTISAIVVAGNTIYIQNGSYVKVGANAYILNTSVAGGNGTPIQWIGYITNHSTVPIGTDRPVFDGDSDANGTDDTATIVDLNNAGNIFKHMIWKNATTTGIDLAASVNAHFENIRLTSNVDGVGTVASSSGNYFLNCEVDNNSSDGMNSAGNYSPTLINCYVHDNTAVGIQSAHTGSFAVAINSIFDSNGGIGFGAFNRAVIINSIAYNNTGAATSGFLFSGADTANLSLALNSIAMNNGQYGFSRNATTRGAVSYFDYNDYNGNGTAGTYQITTGANDLTSDPLFTAPTTGDFTLQSSSPMLSTGFPNSTWSTIVGLTAGDYQWNIGVDQDDNTAAGGVGGGAGFFDMGD
jgi:hypothetical protein